jgi:Bacterial Ig domain
MAVSRDSLSLSLCAQTAPPSPSGPAADGQYQVTERGPHHRVWSKSSWVTNMTERVALTNSYVELATGLHYWDPLANQWRESDPSFELDDQGYAFARHCQHQVIISPNLNSSDGVVVDLQTPDGQRLRSGIVGLNLFDPVSGKSLQVAAVRDVTGTLVSSNEIVWADAFVGLQADVRVRNERGQFHQDVLLKEKLSADALAKLGFDPSTVRLEVWTEFVEAPTPTEQPTGFTTSTNTAPGAALVPPDEADPILEFGSAMEMGAGNAFIEAEPTKTTRVFKQWHQNGSRRWLIEAVRYRELLPLLEALPVKSAALKAAPSSSRLAANRAAPQRTSPSGKLASKGLKIARLDSRSALSQGPRVVWDYTFLNGTLTDYTLKGDTTYYVSGTVILNGNTATTIEGGTVVKFASYNPGVYIQFNGTVRCLTGPYRPAIFTACDDNTVGEVISGSTGNPSGYYASTALYGPSWPTGDLHDLHIRYAYYGITWYYAASRLSNLQLVNCYYGIGRTYCTAPVYNALLNNVQVPFWGYAVNYDIEQATVDGCSQLASVYGTYSQGYINLTNCVLANIPSWGDYNQLNADFNGRCNTPPLNEANDFGSSAPFQSVGAGSHYLASYSDFQQRGTWLINSDLLLALRAKTTYPPQILPNPVQSDTYEAGGMAQRNTLQPDLGYNYDPIDVAANAVVAPGVTLTLAEGVAVAGFGTVCLNLSAGAQLVSQGSAANLNRLVFYNLVQEQPVRWVSQPSVLVWLGASSCVLDLRFTQMAVDRAAASHIYGGNPPSSFWLSDCQLAGGRLVGPTSGAITFKNNLFERVSVGFVTDYSSPNLLNNLFYGGGLSVSIGPAPPFNDNAFDGTRFANLSSDPAINHNAFINTTGFSSTAYGNLTLGSFNYATGARGRFYQASTDLIDKGSQSAVAAGLSGYTTQTSGTPDTSTVDIGFHYFIGSPPTAYAGSAGTCPGQSVMITLQGDDPDGDPLTYIVVQQPQHGTLNPAAGTSDHLLYTPAPNNQGGYDYFTFKVNDGYFDSDTARIDITVGDPTPHGKCQDVMTMTGQAVTFTLTGQDSCLRPLTFTLQSQSGPSNGQITQFNPATGSVTYQPNPGYEGQDFFSFSVANGGDFPPSPYWGQVTINVVSPPTLVATACQPNRIDLYWTLPQKLLSIYGYQYFTDYRIYRCESTSGSCTPTDFYDAVPAGGLLLYADTGVQQGKTYCYRVTFRHQSTCDSSVYESAPSNTQCQQECPLPRVLVSANTGGSAGPIQTYDFVTGDLINTFTPENAGNGRALAIQGGEVFYTRWSDPVDDAIHVCPYGTEGSGGTTDTRTLRNTWRPGVSIQDLAFHNGVLYALTGYESSEQPQVFKINPNTGAFTGPIAIDNPATSDSDGFTVLPDVTIAGRFIGGNLLINEGDQSPVYHEYDGTSGARVPGGLLIDLGTFGFAQGRGVATAPDGQSLYFVAGRFLRLDPVDTFVQTDLQGNIIGFQTISQQPIEDIDVMIP